MNTFFTAVIFLIYCPIYAQVIDDFSDGNFSINPAWEGTVNDYIVNNSSELQLNNSVAATSYLSLPHGLTSLEKKEWHLTTRQEFSYTSETVSPDNDGSEDVLQVNYKMIAPGFVGRFAVYDDRGRKIASVMESELLGVEGFFV